MKIESTTDYDKFVYLATNRDIDMKHVRDLCASIKRKNLLPLNPVLVSSKMEVFDGQHRIEAARMAGVPVFYFASDELDEDDLISLNNIKKKWKNLDYINFYTIKKRAGFGILSKFIVEYSWLPLTTILMVLNPHSARNIAAMKTGNIHVADEEKAKELFDFIAKIGNYTSVYKSRDFILAMRRVVSQNPQFVKEKFMEKLIKNPKAITKQETQREYEYLIWSIYRG